MGALLGAGLLTGAGQIVLRRLTSGNGIDITEAISLHAGRLPAVRTLGSAVLSILVVGMGASLGREGAPKQTGAVIANQFADRARLSDEQRRLLVACGAGAGMAAAYGVPLGGALFALEVLRGAYPSAVSAVSWALIAGPIAGVVSVGYVQFVAWADRNKPTGWRRLVAPIIVLGALGATSIVFPQLLGNGKDIAQLAFMNQVPPLLLLTLLFLRPLATVACLGSGALLGGALGFVWSLAWPGAPAGLFAVLGAAAVLAATTHGPISAVVLMIELTAHDRSFILPLIVIVVTATVVARTLDGRSIYDARFTKHEVDELQLARRPASN
jgi:H+/Cl- antiporter ClcA